MVSPYSIPFRSAEEKVALLLELMADPTTPWTVSEAHCRIENWSGPNNLATILLPHLDSSDCGIVRLALNVFEFHAEATTEHTLGNHVDDFVRMLQHEDRLIRQAAVNLLADLNVSDDIVIDGLQQVIKNNDEPYLAMEAMIATVKLKPQAADNLMPFLIKALYQDDIMIKGLVLDCVDLLGKRAEELLPHVLKLDEIDNHAAMAILKINGDDSYARRVVEKWRTEEELDEPKFLQQAADELEDEIERIITKRPLQIPTFVFFRH